MTRFFFVVGALVLSFAVASAASLLSEKQASAKAISILKGDPYGRTAAAVVQTIKEVRLLRDGNTRACGPRRTPAWEFHIVVVTNNKDQFKNGIIDGHLALNARTGTILCTNLPLLD